MQKPWIVETHAASVACARSRRPSSTKRDRTRSRNSPAAFSVNVIARIAAGSISSSMHERTNRSVNTRVLPDPAFAVTIRRSERRAIAADCSAVNSSLTTAHIGRSRDSCIRPPSSRTSRGAVRAGPL